MSNRRSEEVFLLMDVSTKAYRDSKAKENAWKVVANEVNVLVFRIYI